MKQILVTGAGTLGTELCKQLLKKGYAVRVLDNSEQSLWRFEEAIGPRKGDCLEMILGSILDRNSVVRAMRGVHAVIHTAALKHVRYTNDNPVECISTNIIGTQDLIMEAVRRESIRKFIFISTDKACFPINIYGESKRVGESLTTWAHEQSGKAFLSCRFGNYLGSSGSVIDRWKEQRKSGAISLTDPNMRRFFIKPREVAEFIIGLLEDSGAGGGKIYLPMMKVIDMETLASAVSESWGVEVKTIGKFPGEKMDELLLNQEEMSRAVFMYPKHIEIGKGAGSMQAVMLSTQFMPQMTKEEVKEYIKEVLE